MILIEKHIFFAFSPVFFILPILLILLNLRLFDIPREHVRQKLNDGLNPKDS